MNIRWAVRVRSLEGLDAALAAGFKRVQMTVDAVMTRDEAGFIEDRERLVKASVSFETFEAPLPKNVQVTERGFNTYYWTEYLGTALHRISELGCKILTWGDGLSRILPMEGDISTAREHFYQFMFMLCDIAERHGIRVCLEPLGPRRTNFLNSLEELDECLSMIGRPNLAMAISPRDLQEFRADADELPKYASKVAHVHLEHPGSPNASVPPSPSDGYDYLPFFHALSSIAYEGVAALPPGSSAETLAYCERLLATAVSAP